MKNLDMLGKPCPIPVIEARKLLKNGHCVTVRVDNIVAVQNLEKMAKGSGYEFSYTQESTKHYTVIISGDGEIVTQAAQEPTKAEVSPDGAVVLITKNKMGGGSDDLGKILIKGYIYALTELPTLPKKVIFLNSGVKLAVEGSNTIEDLKKLEELGTEVCSCGTCLNYYELSDKLSVGKVVDMYYIAESLSGSNSTITL